MSDLHAQALEALLSGQFICRTSNPRIHAYMNDEGVRIKIDNYLKQIGRTLSATSKESGYFMALCHDHPEARATAKERLTEVKKQFMPVVLFFDALLRTLGREDLLLPGQIIETSQLVAKIDEDPGFQETLRGLAPLWSITDATDNGKLLRLLKRLTDQGYLHLMNEDRGLYQVTAKLEYLVDAVKLVMDHIKPPSSLPAEAPKNRALV